MKFLPYQVEPLLQYPSLYKSNFICIVEPNNKIMPAKIMVVDDEPDLKPLIRQIFRRQIRQNELQLIFASNGVEALSELEAQPDIDIVLTDINMPQMDGLTLLTKLSEQYPTIKAVIISAYGDMENIRSAMNRGAFDFLTKPLNLQDLEITTTKTLRHVQQVKETLQKEHLAQQAQGELLKNLQQEVAERQRAQEALRDSERRLTQVLEAMPVGVFVADANGQPYYVNSRAQQLFGQGIVANAKAEQLPRVYRTYLAGKNCIYPQERDPILRALQGESVRVDDMEIRRTNITIPIEVWGRPIYDDKGRVAYAIAAFTDITERKQAEAERHKLIQELCELNGNLEVALDAELNLIKAATRFVPNQFLSLLGHQSLVDVQLGDQVQQEMSVLFSDIRDFTALSEAMTPQETFEFINAYLERMEPAIAEHNGFIDKYMGDGIMALFSGGADDAVKAGIAMLQSLAEYNQYRANFGLIPIQIGIGINTGSLMLGTVGGKNRMDGTVISDAVNLASRVEGLTKLYGVSMLITEKTFLELNEPIYAIRPIERVKVKGKSKLVMVYEVFEADPPEVKEGKLATSHIFIAALYQYKLNNFREAGKLFADCLRQNPKDSVAKIYLHRCHENDRILINNPQIFSYSAR